ncbi:type-F conjugative transfer system pilin assembly thiol-disulfide isomerase TrbB [Rahnella sp. AA]|uniref:type-F conjugative transfer system pilin assembly thiol-disulfide isomerase TrbB n=1 Tax=Rahnella sp. AA TaxID=2057180 RepID=UPI000C34F725|nr:type-F conjugative transfer system pilin assembly thiol-disulfide isomerase TrbB [Rahnella sp. AA]PKE28128.1 type-F conjugative transfer system pilin assembly thiol-disulfide isomerase TrbB [Rahnella sp. AA]
MMRKRIKTACLSALLLSLTAQASTRDDIRAIEAAKGNPSTSAPVEPAKSAVKPARWATLSNGQRVNLNDWKVVVFMQSTCAYCQRFDPMLKAFSEESGLSVTAFSLDAKGDAAFPDALQATPEVMVQFFTPGMPVATPTTFLVNVHTLATYPLLQGAVDKPALASRLDEVFQVAMSGRVK